MKALTIAEYIITYSNSKGYYITNLKLNKLLYYIQKESINRFEEKCFDDDIAWCRHGAIVEEVYKHIKPYCEIDENLNCGWLSFLFNGCDIYTLTSEIQKLIEAIVDKYKNIDGWDMINLIKSEIGNRYKRGDIVL